ncbi:MAG: apolipoprotein N-acyltransferase, partial [Phormidesmis sp. CAN_BIN44]|nr:apolipoprotein N-acyltransferase [Phormidesmis sp. CAN_BIN44]
MVNSQDFKPRSLKIKSDRAFQLAIALISGIFMGLTPAPFNVWGLAWIAIAPLWVLVTTDVSFGDRSRSRFKVLLALAWGLGYHGFALAWIVGLHPLMWLGVPWLASVTIVLVVWLFITFWGAALVGIWAWVMGWMAHVGVSPWLRVLTGTAVWSGLETIWAGGALNWTSVSYT